MRRRAGQGHSWKMAQNPNQGCVAAVNARVTVYLTWTGDDGGGAPSVNVIMKKLFPNYKGYYSSLSVKKKAAVDTTQAHRRTWQINQKQQAVLWSLHIMSKACFWASMFLQIHLLVLQMCLCRFISRIQICSTMWYSFKSELQILEFKIQEWPAWSDFCKGKWFGRSLYGKG